MKLHRRYSSAVTNQPFLFDETRTVAQLLRDGNDWAQIKHAVEEENLLHCRSKATRENVFQGIAARLKPAPAGLIDQLLDSPLHGARLVNFVLCLCHFRLLRELMAELVMPLRQRGVRTLTAFEVHEFFAHKRQQQDALDRWQDSTFERVKSNTLRLASDAEVIMGPPQGPWQLPQVLVPPALAETLRAHDAAAFIALVGQEI